jgi:hypothetical protein
MSGGAGSLVGPAVPDGVTDSGAGGSTTPRVKVTVGTVDGDATECGCTLKAPADGVGTAAATENVEGACSCA